MATPHRPAASHERTSEDEADNTAPNMTTPTTSTSALAQHEVEGRSVAPKTHGPDKAHQLAVRPYEVPDSGEPMTVSADPDDCICILRAMCQALGAAERTHYRGLAISALEEAQHWLHDVKDYEVEGKEKPK
jgi:hypothetical protein